MDPLEKVRSSCASFLSSTDLLSLGDPDAFEAAASTFSGLPPPTSPGIDLPLRLSEDESIDATVFVSLLQMGSGYRKKLHAACGSGASDCMLRGILSFILGGKSLSAGVLAHLKSAEIAEIWGIPMSIDEPVPNLSFVTMSKPGPLASLVNCMTQMLNSVGRELLATGFSSFSAFFKANCALWQEGGSPKLGKFIGVLVDTFPSGFRDLYNLKAVAQQVGQGKRVEEVWLLKKAQLCAKELGRKFGASHPALFSWPQSPHGSLTAFADNVLPTVLRAEGVLVLSEALGDKVDRGEDVGAEEACALRSATVVACESLSKLMGVSEEYLDQLLWISGKLPKYRSLERHAEPSTPYY